ncbi:hypothetical protein BDV93DRAFT_105541 [Ceratobasidium sp. AG-I]|nr:hypothetical protein BDV93DRAFT_105541 [Ceratobasidium sp. AG-I]
MPEPSTTIATTVTKPAITHTTKSEPARPKVSLPLCQHLSAFLMHAPNSSQATSTRSSLSFHWTKSTRNTRVGSRLAKPLAPNQWNRLFGSICAWGVVVKVVPLRMAAWLQEKWAYGEGPCISEVEDVRKEIAVTGAMGDIRKDLSSLSRRMLRVNHILRASRALGCVSSRDRI